MAIQVRRGLKKDFDPYKMLPGEWAVSIDAQTQNQIVWMCFAAGVVKRMGTYEDFYAQIEEITNDILEKFLQILADAAQQLQNNVEIYIQGKVDNEWIPALQAFTDRAESAANAAEISETNAKESENNSKLSEENAKISENNAKESEKNAALSEKNADDWSKLSESHNHGGTGFRSGEDTDNSKYWSERSKEEADRAKSEADKAEQYANITAPGFYLDLDSMELYIKDGVGVDFVLDDDDVLYWAVS